MSAPRRLRVVQWATGNIGRKSLREVIRHPGFELVGVWVHAEDKIGRDAGELCGADPVGIAATNDLDEIVALGADCVLYMPRALDADVVCRLLAGGANVVTTRGEFHHPGSMDPDLRRRIERASEEGAASIHSTGSSPGFITEAIPLVLTSIQRRLDRLVIEEFADLSPRDSPDLLFQVMGFGRPPAEMGQHRIDHGRTSFGPSLHLVAEALGRPLDGLTSSGEIAVTPRDVEIAAGPLAAGTAAAQRLTVTGSHGGRPLIEFRATWYCTSDLEPAWEVRPTGWRVRVEGDAPLDVGLPFPVSMEDMAATTPGYTANRAVNAVGVVCAAEPGIRTILDLPSVIADLSG